MTETCAIIFSMNRAMQLDALLRSLFYHCTDVESMDIYVLYRTTDDIHTRQYQDLSKQYPSVQFVFQNNFRGDLVTIINPYPVGSNPNRLYRFISNLGDISLKSGTLFFRFWRNIVESTLLLLGRLFLPLPEGERFLLFLVDDSIFTNACALQDVISTFRQQRGLLGFSFRLGKNTTHCYMTKQPQELPVFLNICENIFSFNWVHADQDFGYPLEISSSIYPLENILPLLIGISFCTPNGLEQKLAYHAKKFCYTHPYLGCYRRSVAFCNPVNMVQDEISNRAGDEHCYQSDELQARFEQGERIKVDVFNGLVTNACHQEEIFYFEKGESS